MIEAALIPWESFDFLSFFSSVTGEDVEKVLRKEKLSERDFLVLLSDKAENYLENMARKSKEVTLRHFGRSINLFTPLYLSNYCRNSCVYCGFNQNQEIRRHQLTMDEVRIEAGKIRDSGLKHILILSGGDRVKTDIFYLLETVEILKEYFDSISIEVYAMSEEEYTLLIGKGVNNVTLYQETYNRSLYEKLHLSGEKADYTFRLNAPGRAASAGVFSVNLGVLLGLDHPCIDFFKAALHGQYIQNTYPGTAIAMSFPRIRPAARGFSPEYDVSDAKLVQLITAFRLFMPRAEISISTRESSILRDHLLPLGVTKMSAGSSTSVGSRSREEGSDEQFQISDGRSVSDMDRDLIQAGYQPVYKDWVAL
jgi:2-iminoacetate synthase